MKRCIHRYLNHSYVAHLINASTLYGKFYLCYGCVYTCKPLMPPSVYLFNDIHSLSGYVHGLYPPRVSPKGSNSLCLASASLHPQTYSSHRLPNPINNVKCIILTAPSNPPQINFTLLYGYYSVLLSPITSQNSG